MTDTIIAPAAARQETRPRSVAVAALVSFFVPGLGHVYAGRPGRGIVVALAGLTWGMGILLLVMLVPVRSIRIPLILLLPVGVAMVMWDAARITRPVRKRYVLQPYNRWYVYLIVICASSIVGAVVKAEILRWVAHPYSLPATSMEPTLLQGDYVMASPRPPATVRRGDVVVYGDADESYVHRVAAVPGDVVGMRKKVLWLNGRPVREPYAVHIDPVGNPAADEMGWQRAFLADPAAARAYTPTRDDWGPLRVPAGRYLLLGDNRDNSYDGRLKGFVPREAITGQPVWIYFSRAPDGSIRWSRIGASVH
jgi:signal peptidase I